MKKSFKLLFASLAITLGIGAAAVAGVSAHSFAKEAEPVRAATTEGVITIDTTGGDWAANNSDGSGQNFSVYFYNSTTNGWGSYVHGAYQQYLVEVPYSLNFVPTNMIAVRYSPWVAETGTDSWTSNPWRSDTWGKWNQTADLSFSANGNIYIQSWNSDAGNNNATVGYAILEGKGSSTSWSWTTLDTFTNVKLNGSNHAEYYLTRTFNQWDEFGAKIDGAFVGYSGVSYSDFVDTSNWKQEGSNIQYTGSAKEFSVYFDRNSSTVFIEDPYYAAANDWSMTFLSGDCSYSKSNWTTLGTSFGNLHASAKAIFLTVPEMGDESGYYYEQAVARYDLVLKTYGRSSYTDFMGRVTAGKVTPKNVNNIFTISNNDGSSIVVVVSALLLSGVAVGGYFLLRRKKEKNI